jgi:hypothetical protein
MSQFARRQQLPLLDDDVDDVVKFAMQKGP